jgi:hypothetical protein
MREQPMEADIYSENAEHVHSDSKNDDSGPAEEPGNQGQRCQRVTENKSDQRVHLQFHRGLSDCCR